MYRVMVPEYFSDRIVLYVRMGKTTGNLPKAQRRCDKHGRAAYIINDTNHIVYMNRTQYDSDTIGKFKPIKLASG